MRISTHQLGISQTVIALAICAAFNPAQAQDGDIAQLIKPESTISVGIGGVDGDGKDRAIFGQYNGMRKNSAFALIDLDYLTRDDATGTWMNFNVLNLGLDTRELSFSRSKQGDWKYYVEYSELERNYPRTINTGMSGVGTTTPVVSRLATPGSGADVDLKTQRKSASVGYEKWITNSLQFEVNFKNEKKTGARLWGRGYDCASYVCGTSTTTAINQANFVKNAILLLPEPIDSITKQIEAKFNFHTENLLVSAGYYGSFYLNSYGNMTPTVPNMFNNGQGNPLPGYPAVGPSIIAGGGTSLQNVLQTPMALPPDNQAHQIYLNGSYSFTPTTKANFKYAYSHATQNDSYAGMGLSGAPAGSNSLDARVDSVLAQLGLSARPFDKLNVLANVRYEKKDDKTPLAQYNVEAVSVVPATTPASFTNVGAFWDNNRTSSTRLAGKLEATYRLPGNFRATAGVDYNSLEREVPVSLAEEKVAGISTLREKNNDRGYRLELRRNMSETINGGVSYSSSKRNGSNWTSLSTLNPATPGISAANLALINMYCGGVACYGQQLPATSILGMSATTAFPLSMTDVKRDKWKISADWNPAERFSLQLVVENGKDKNTEPFNDVAGGKGWRDSDVKLISLDASYAIAEGWNLNAYGSRGEQTLHINHSTGYMAGLKNANDTLGVGLDGKFSSRLDVGANFSYLVDENIYALAANTGTSGTLPGTLTVVAPSASNLAQAKIGLPDATFHQTALKFFAKYMLDRQADLRVDLIHQRIKFTEWQWGNNGVPFVYADNTTVNMKPIQNVTFVGVTYIRKF
ncbi:MAG: MtrB/PioB family decaheme-associated outer membrane protein [Pseudomonadota bacterium]